MVVHTIKIVLAAVVIFITSNRVKFVLWQSSLPSPLKENSLKQPFHLFCTKRTLSNITLIPVLAWTVLSRTGVEEQPINTFKQRNRNQLLVTFAWKLLFCLNKLYFGFFSGELFFGISVAHLLWQRLISENGIWSIISWNCRYERPTVKVTRKSCFLPVTPLSCLDSWQLSAADAKQQWLFWLTAAEESW